MAFWAWTVDRPARWKFLMPNCSFAVVLAALAWTGSGVT
jgi:hypothetical protein